MKHALLFTDWMDSPFRNQVKNVVEQDTRFHPTKWATLTFYPSSPGNHDIDFAVGTFKRYCVALAHKLNAHGYPVAGLGTTQQGSYHFHFTWMSENGRKTPTYDLMCDLWWKGVKRGRSENWTYDPGQGGIPYSLDARRGHNFYVPTTSLYCPNRKKCENGCVKNFGFHDPVLSILGPSGMKIAC
jgi:hypothetical protein